MNLAIALKLKATSKEHVLDKNVWNFMLNHMIHYGFHRGEVKLLLHTIKNIDVQSYVDSYDQILSAATPKEILRFEPLHTQSEAVVRSAYLMATKERVGKAQPGDEKTDRDIAWNDVLTKWIRANRNRVILEQILNRNSVPDARKNEIMALYGALKECIEQ
ncbi:hypothetical protein Plhal304r1_c022g0077331 [Plasmopara halstedii]